MTQQKEIGTTIALSGHRPFPFDVTHELFNVQLVYLSPCGDVMVRKLHQGNNRPLDWERANQWVHGIMEGIGKEWEGSRRRWVDCYIEPISCPRPWMPSLLAAYQRELARMALTDLDASIKRGDTKHLDAGLATLDGIMGWPTMQEVAHV